MPNPTRATGRTPGGPATLYTALTVVLVVLIASLAFSARQPPPPQIAELTPQAQHQITRAPNQLQSSLGSAGGPGAGGGIAASSAAASTTLPGPQATLPGGLEVAPQAHHCYGNPPMQIAFDTQSPPCVAYWAGDNGGATARGVTASTIRIACYDGDGTYGSRVLTDLQLFFNRNFELYGRRITCSGHGSSGSGSSSSSACAGLQASADGLAQSGIFATMDPNASADPCYMAEAAHDHVVAISDDEVYTRSQMASLAPYLYAYPMALDEDYANMGAFICSQLAGRPARFSPNPIYQGTTRKFGIIAEYDYTPYPPDLSPLENRMRSCGAAPAVVKTWENPEQSGTQQDENDAQLATFPKQAVIAMQNAGVTTVVCLCVIFAEEGIPAAADSQAYYPEWMLEDNWLNVYVKTFWPDADQRQGMFAIGDLPAQVPYPYTTLNQALATVDPGFEVNSNTIDFYTDQIAYWTLLEIASGIQMAGPDLTPYSFQSGLQAARFPNPYSPEMEGVVGFNGGSHAMTTDEAVMWWSNSAPSPFPDEAVGAWCYVDGGRRFSLAQWATTPQLPLYQGACDSNIMAGVA